MLLNRRERGRREGEGGESSMVEKGNTRYRTSGNE
jgi:hypothetical protein